jgi:cytochrome c oxidase assembly factor CtaG
MFLGMAFVILQTPIYEGFYGRRALEHGLTPAEDQQIAGGLMLGIDFLVMIGALIFFFLRAAEDADRAEDAERARESGGSAGAVPERSDRESWPLGPAAR